MAEENDTQALQREAVEPASAGSLRCGEVLQWNAKGTKPVKRCENLADWKNLAPCRDSILGICDACASKRFPRSLATCQDWARINPANAGHQTPAAAGVEAKQKAIGGLSA